MKSSNRFLSIRIAALGLMVFSAFRSDAQIGDDKLNFTIEATLPSGRANPAFRNCLNGLVNAQPKVQYKFAPDWFAGVGLRYSYFTVSEFKVPQKTTGGLHVVGGFAEVGWNKWQTERFGLEIAIKGGIAQNIFITDLTRASGIQRVNAVFVQPTLSFILAADEAVAYRWIIGYNIDGYDFKPYHLGMDTQGGYTADELNKPSQSLLVGFAFSYYFGNDRDADINQ